MQDQNWKKAAPKIPEEFHIKFEETLEKIEGQKKLSYKRRGRKTVLRILAATAVLCCLAVTTIAFLYCIWAVVGSGAKEVMWSFVTLMVITAMYALNYNRLHKNPYPLDVPISKD